MVTLKIQRVDLAGGRLIPMGYIGQDGTRVEDADQARPFHLIEAERMAEQVREMAPGVVLGAEPWPGHAACGGGYCGG